jgi:hypothetical protein
VPDRREHRKNGGGSKLREHAARAAFASYQGTAAMPVRARRALSTRVQA